MLTTKLEAGETTIAKRFPQDFFGRRKFAPQRTGVFLQTGIKFARGHCISLVTRVTHSVAWDSPSPPAPLPTGERGEDPVRLGQPLTPGPSPQRGEGEDRCPLGTAPHPRPLSPQGRGEKTTPISRASSSTTRQ